MTAQTDPTSNAAAGCPFHQGGAAAPRPATRRNADWWPNQLDLRPLHANSAKASPHVSPVAYWMSF